MTTLTTHLESAAKNLDTKPEAALSALVTAWREKPCLELFELVSRFEAGHPPPPFDGDTEAFLKTARKPDVAEVGSLARVLLGPTSDETITRLQAIRAWDPDPRVSAALEHLLREVPFTSDSTRPVWTALFELVVKVADPRFLQLADDLPKQWRLREKHHEWLAGQLADAVTAMKRASGGAPEEALTDAERKAVASLAARLVTARPAR